ncbi:MAG: metallopeptidase TldD-related protein [Candidatus Binatus sp.]|uniref:metallopeptidase TldD-related protein n=1 Tax=Candidatus Binatus sp. TaxID=2811406 RepID=UPI0027205144|nr:metallopeptidase TldD-related protein [Candidatus Binatus sp.]MDO8432936.1 metallopeptidase TldD-related protein [Candidatus Binatus sp.]
MLELEELKKFVHDAAREIAREKDIASFEVYAATAENRIARINYTSDIPCRGLEEFKSIHADGFQVRIAMLANPHEVGIAFEARDLSREALRDALDRARSAAIVDPHFPGFPDEPKKIAHRASDKSDLARVGDRAIANAAWAVLEGALSAFRRSKASRNEHPGLIIGGDVSVIRDRIAVFNSNFSDIRIDQSAYFNASATSIIESLDAKGTAVAIGANAASMRDAASVLGRDAVKRALALAHGVRPASGKFRVVLGPQPIAEILNYMVMGSLTSGAFHAASSAYHARFGEQVMDARLSLADDPAHAAGAMRRRITCEGIPASRVELIRDGKLVGLLSNFYDTHRLLTDEHRSEKLGAAAGANPDFPPLSGYRLGEGGGRRFDAHPGSAGTNVVMRAGRGLSDRELMRAVGDGVYIGRIWYTYPINGQRAGDFTCTVTGDSYVIRNGEIAVPLAPNCLRINANIAQVFEKPIAVGARSRPATVWGSPEAYYVPAIAADEIDLAEVGVTA